MNTSFSQDPPVRIDRAAHAHLRRIVGVLRNNGLGISMVRWLSDLILAQPIPTPNGHQPGGIVTNDEAGSEQTEKG